MATIRRNRSGNWEAQVRRKGWPAQTGTFDTRKQAEDWSRDIEAEMRRGTFVSRAEAERTTLAEALDRYESEVSALKKGHPQERYRLAMWRKHALGQRPLAAVRSKDLADYIARRRAAGCAASTIHNEIALLSHLFTVARRRWGMEGLDNPVALVERPTSAHNARNRRLRPGEEEKLLGAAPAWLKPLIIIALETAMRQGEIRTLRWDQIDLNRRVAHLLETKAGSARDVPLSPRAVEVFRSLPRCLDGKVFPATKNSITHAFAQACRGAGIAGLHFHDLRHEAASRLFEAGWNPMEVAAVTGHKTLQMLKRYTHLRAEDLARKMAGERLRRYR